MSSGKLSWRARNWALSTDERAVTFRKRSRSKRATLGMPLIRRGFSARIRVPRGISRAATRPLPLPGMSWTEKRGGSGSFSVTSAAFWAAFWAAFLAAWLFLFFLALVLFFEA